MPENKRIPLRDGTKLTDNIEIIRLISDHGGSSLVYLARQNAAYHVIVKEYYPFDGFSLRRERNRCCLSCTSDEPDFQNAVNDFRNQQNQHIRAITPEGDEENYHSLYYFECNDITDEVKKRKPFQNTVSAYLVFSTTNGLTLEDYAEHISQKTNQGKPLSLEQILYIVRSILCTVKHLHVQLGYLHLDLKPDNVFLSTDITEIERVVCFLLDLEGMQKIGHITSVPRLSENFAAPEISALIETNFSLIHCLKTLERQKKFHQPNETIIADLEKTIAYLETDHKVLLDNIGCHSDTYSIACIFFKLLMGSKYNHRIWEAIKSQQEQESLTELIKKEIRTVLFDPYPYLFDRITNMLAKGLYCLEGNNPAFAAEFSKRRYASCSDFIADIDTCLEILHNDGFHSEVLAAYSRRHFANDYYFRRAGQRASNNRTSENLIADDNLFVADWFPDIVE